MTNLTDVRNILIVSDDDGNLEILETICRSIFSAPAIRKAHACNAALNDIDEEIIDLALLKFELPDGKGIDLLQQVLRHSPKAKCVLTNCPIDYQQLYRALRAGALGYLTNERKLSHERVYRMTGKKLTGRELEVLQLIAKGCRVKDVSELLHISNNTVSHHIKHIYSKLNVHNRAEATALALQLGIL